jgi:hypothetical protein
MKEKSKITSLFPTKERREVLTGLSLLLLSLSCVTEGAASFHQRLRFARFARPKVSLRATKGCASLDQIFRFARFIFDDSLLALRETPSVTREREATPPP